MKLDGTEQRVADRRATDLVSINQRLDEGEVRMTTLEQLIAANTALTQEIADNTKGFVAFQNELEKGTRFICRVVKGMEYLLGLIERFWRKGLILFCIVYLLTHDFTFPPWLVTVFKAVVL